MTYGSWRSSIGRHREAICILLAVAFTEFSKADCQADLWTEISQHVDLNSTVAELQEWSPLVSTVWLKSPNSTIFLPIAPESFALFDSYGDQITTAAGLLQIMSFNSLPQAKTVLQLLSDQTAITQLGVAIGNSSFGLIATTDGDDVALVSALSDSGVAYILQSFEICGSWIHLTDRLLIPTALAPEQTKSFQSYIGAQYILQKEETSMFYEFWEAVLDPPMEPSSSPRAHTANPSPDLSTTFPLEQPLPVGKRRQLLSALDDRAKRPRNLIAVVIGASGGIGLVALTISMLGCFGRSRSSEEVDKAGKPGLQKLSSLDLLKVGLKGVKSMKRLGSLESLSSQASAHTRFNSGLSTGSSSKSPCIGRGEPYKQDLNPMGFIPSARLAEQMRQQSLRSCESLDDEMGTGASIASLRSAKSAWEMNSWELDASEVQICLDSKNRPWQLGSGGFGSVFRAEMAGSTPVAVKFVNRQSPRELRRFVHEIGILKSLRHTNIVQFLGAFLEEGQMILVTEYMVGGDLWNVLGHDTDHNFSWYKRGQHVALDFVRGVVHMHSRHIVHLDLKSANILLSRDGTAKIADVGLAKILSREITQVSMQSTFDWAAPEVLAGQECNEKADIWSVGVVLWEVCSGEAPKLRQLRTLSVPEECPEAVRDVIMACRASDPADRPTAKEVFRRLSTVVHPNRPRAAGSILSSSLWNPQNSYHGRPPWAPPEHADGEENPSFMACIQEDGPPDNVGQQSNPRRSDQRKACQPFRQDQPQGMVQQSKLELASHRAMSL